MLVELIPIITSLGAFAMVFGIVYIKSRENMALIERGINPRIKESRPRPFVNLKWGLLFIGSGCGLLLAYLLDTLLLGHTIIVTKGSISSADSDNPAIYFALIAIGGGLGLFYSYKIEKREWLDKNKNV